MITEFFLPMEPPTCTHQEKKVGIRKGKPYFYEPPELKAARSKLMGSLGKYIPDQVYAVAVRLTVKWCFPCGGKNAPGTWKTSKPDTDNLQKLLKDIMTDLHYWMDDALVCSEIVEKFYDDVPGIYIRIDPLE